MPLIDRRMLLAGLAVGAAFSRTAWAANPVLPGWYADPEIRIFGDRYWIYPTYSTDAPLPAPPSRFTPWQADQRASQTIWSPFLRQTFLDAFSSPDLVSWTRHPRVLDVEDVDWAAYAVWAPSAIEQDGRYFLFFGANDIKNDRQRGGCASRFRWPGPVAFRAIADPGSGLDRSRSPGWRDRLATVSRYVAPTFRDFCRPCMSSAQQGINGERNC